MVAPLQPKDTHIDKNQALRAVGKVRGSVFNRATAPAQRAQDTRMKILFVHQNFPDQFKFLAPTLVQQGHTVLAMSMQKTEAITWQGVRLVPYSAARGTTDQRTGVATGTSFALLPIAHGFQSKRQGPDFN